MLLTIMSGRSMQNFVLVRLVCLAIASAISCSSVESSNTINMCLESERDALLQFKQGLVEESNALASWITEKDCCKWRGIACNNHTGHVTSLNISLSIYADGYYYPVDDEVRLRGEISPSLLELKYLNYLDLSFVNFGGMMIPKFIGSLSQLKVLKLLYANFSGPVPPQLGNLSNLHTLDLSFNDGVSSENLEWLAHLSSLTYLGMSGIDFSKVVNWPQSLSKLTSLRELHLSDCRLRDVNIKSLTPLINSSTSLQLLDLSSNSLNSTIFYWLANVSTDFVHIDLHSNKLEGGIPKGFQNLCRLESLYLAFNKLSGNIEDSIKALSCAINTLETMDLGYNQFWGSFPELTGFSKLRSLDLFENNITGYLPQSVGQLSSLEVLFLGGNHMSGVITESHFRNLSHLQSLVLSGNGFSINLSSDWNPPFQLTDLLGMRSCKLGPAFPKWILTHANNVSLLDLSNNGISGPLPNKFGDLFSSLYYLDLSMNQIHRILPNLSATRLDYVNLSSNLFSGAVPLFPPTVYRLDLSHNKFSGALPLFPPIVYQLDLSHNKFSGAVPLFPPNTYQLDLSHNEFSGALPLFPLLLDILDLSHNKFSGPLSSSFCATMAPNLRSLDISDNLLSGELPNCWMKFQDLFSLNFGRNKFYGKLPNSLGNLESINVLRLHENNFSGELPPLENCSNLYVVDLGNNNLSGKIPTWIGRSLQSLLILRLRSNQFHGVIPFSLCNLTVIHVLDLSHNNISGPLPHCFNNISALAYDDDVKPFDVEMKLVWKGIEREFGKNLDGMRSIDISSNYLVGELPPSIATMTELKSLNLSRNYLIGKLPEDFGNMKMLESLDLSRNNLFGNIPTSFSRLNYLGVMDISHNHLSGRIPTGTQLQSFNDSAYVGNPGLCGVPLTELCLGDGTIEDDGIRRGGTFDTKEHDNHGLLDLGFLISTVLGFVTGFWIACGSLLLKSSWRYAFFKFLDDSRNWIYIKMAVYKEKMQKRLQR